MITKLKNCLMTNSNLKLKLFLPILFFGALFMTSCNDEDTLSQVEVENYVEDAVFRMQKSCMVGIRGCYDLLFPVVILFPDTTEAEVDSYENMKETIKAWKEINPDYDERPSLQFPVDIMTDDGEIIIIEDRDGLRVAIKDCVRDFINSHPKLNNRCYHIAFPINLKLPNGEFITLENRHELKHLLRRWKANYPNTDRKPQIQFPITIVLKEDGSKHVINSPADLRALKEECRS